MKKNLLLTLVAVVALVASGVMQAAVKKTQPVRGCANGKCGVRR